MSTLYRGKARQKPVNPNVKRLAAQTRAGNTRVMTNFGTMFANAVNGVVAYASRAEAEKARDSIEQGIKAGLKYWVDKAQSGYKDGWDDSSLFGINPTGTRMSSISAGAESFGNRWRMSRRWFLKKFNHLKGVGGDGSPFRGFGYFGGKGKKNAAALNTPLKTWVAGLDKTADAERLYQLLGVAKLQISGDLPLRKGYTQTNTGFLDPKKRKVPMKEALKKTRPHQVEGKGLVIQVNKNNQMVARVKGRQVSLLELNKAGLVGSTISIVALSNMFRGYGMPKNRGYKFYEHAQRFAGGQFDIFGKSAGTKLHFAAKSIPKKPWHNDPLGNLLELTIQEIIPRHITVAMNNKR